MEPIFLTCMVLAFFFTKGKVDSAAYANGKEPPGVAKARMRHDEGGGGHTASGKPKGPGAFRLLAASRWANACEAAKQRSEHKAARRRAWYDETAPLKDEKWREKKRRKLDKADKLRDRWIHDRGLVNRSEVPERQKENAAWDENTLRDAENEAWEEDQRRNATADFEAAVRRGMAGIEEEAWKANKQRDAAAAAARDGENRDTSPPGEPEPGNPTWEELLKAHETQAAAARRDQAVPEQPGPPETPEERQARLAQEARDREAWQRHRDARDDAFINAPDTEVTTPGTAVDLAGKKPANSAPSAQEGSTVYQQAVTDLIAAADVAAQYRNDLAAFADTLGGKRWGVEVTGPIADVNSELVALEGEYRDLAAQMKHQGDQGAAAHEQAPWVPADDSILV